MTGPARIALAAGGTGGHMYPAEALAGELLARGYEVALVTDRRGGGFGERLPAVATHRISAGAMAGTGVVGRAQGVMRLGVGFFQSRSLVARLKPDVVVGFGGYASAPAVLAASLVGITTVLHEQNAILGRANRMLARRATRIAASFENLEGAAKERLVVTGNPVRPAIAALGQERYVAIEPGGRINLLVIGGSQGARVFSNLIPETIGLLPEALQRRFDVVQQARAEDLERARASYAKLAANVELASFFADIPQRLRAAHLVIARAGASTVAELAAAGRPSILIPYPYAADDHQTANAAHLNMGYAALVMAEAAATPADLAAWLKRLVEGTELPAMAQAARRLGRPDAARRLADLVTSLVRGNGARQEAAA
jgi:UDP-N-acetylglucosamine--N-acetylmuramyl-(pentapeptide) pyrophosphoryl-undecaprenol N-acetylglucosamine transferase